jgi:hypothetical protein
MCYVFGITSGYGLAELSRHRTRESAERAAARWLNNAPTVTARGVLVHSANGATEARDIAQTRLWSEGVAMGFPMNWLKAPKKYDLVLEGIG